MPTKAVGNHKSAATLFPSVDLTRSNKFVQLRPGNARRLYRPVDGEGDIHVIAFPFQASRRTTVNKICDKPLILNDNNTPASNGAVCFPSVFRAFWEHYLSVFGPFPRRRRNSSKDSFLSAGILPVELQCLGRTPVTIC